MTLPNGSILSHYEIISPLGKGGMGEVYQATDKKLGREVAIKILPEEFAKDADRVARFQREAKLLASLNHPNIATIHGLEESGGTNFIVLELVEGETLAVRIKRGPIPVEESLKLALQIAEALEAAHERGVIHRDLKPANIKITPEDKVKVLDFGLAKAFAGEQADLNLTNSPTLSIAATQQGIILGTAAYMSPEQARGKPVDKRTDIWAFGCVLYEMLTGKAPFQGEDVTEILAAVVKSEVNLDLFPENIHPRVCEVIIRCLQKEKKKRYADISEALYEIERVLADPGGVFTQPVTIEKPHKKQRLGLPGVAAIAVLCIISGGLTIWKMKPTEMKRVMRFDYDLPEREFGLYLLLSSVAVSPDGAQIVYVANNQLFLKNANELNARPIQGTEEDPWDPFFSPDGQWIGYFSFAESHLKKIAVMGGVSQPLCEVPRYGGASWAADDTIVFVEQNRIMKINADGGTPEEVFKGDNDELFNPQVLPDGNTILFTYRANNSLQVAVYSPKNGERKNLFAGGPAQYVSTGHLVFASDWTLYAIAFDPGSLSVSGSAVSVAEDVFRFGSEVPTHSAISETGTLVYMPAAGTQGLADLRRTMVWVDRDGKEEPLSAESDDYGCPKISPDETKVAFSIDSGEGEEIWIWDLVRENWIRLTNDDAFNEAPLWTPDSQRIVFISTQERETAVKWIKADGSGEIETLIKGTDGELVPSSWSEDGKILVVEIVAPRSRDIGTLLMEGDYEWKPILQENYDEFDPQISPDGHWMAYVSNETGGQEVYVRPFPDVDKGGLVSVSTKGGYSPLWSPDSKELFYRNGDSVMVVTVKKGPKPIFGTPEVLFNGTYESRFEIDLSRLKMWDIGPRGMRFLMMKPVTKEGESESPIPRKLNIVLNWFEELKQKVPTP